MTVEHTDDDAAVELEALLRDSSRLAAVRRTCLLDTPPEEVFDRFVRLASRLLGTSAATFGLLDRDRLFFKSTIGLPEPWASRRECPLYLTFCQALVRQGPFALEDASADGANQGPAIPELGFRGYLGVPLRTPEGHRIGILSVMDTRPRAWTPVEIACLQDLAAAVSAEVELGAAQREAASARREGELAQARYRNLVEDIDAIVWEADAVTWQFTFVSRQAERILGYPVDRWLSTPNFWVETLHLADRATAVQFCAAATAQGRDHMFEYRAVAKDGRIVWLRDIVRVICGPDGRAQRLRGIMIDVTAQKEIERELLYKKSLLEVQSEASVLGILVVSAEGTMVSFNRRFVEMWRLPPEVVNSRSDDAALRAVTDQLTAPQEYMARVAHLYSHPEERSRDEIILKDGRIFDRYSESVYSDGTYDGRVWFFQDVTQERQAERRKDEFIAMLGHELRNPLAPMLSAVQLLRLPGLPLEKQARA